MMTVELPIKLSVLNTTFSSVQSDHYNQETGCFILSLSTEIGRLVALSEGVSSPEARESLGRTVSTLEGLLTLEASKLGLRQPPPQTAGTEPLKVHRAKHYPLRPNIEVNPTHAERAEVPRYCYQQRVAFVIPPETRGGPHQVGRTIGVKFTMERNWFVRVRDAAKVEHWFPARDVWKMDP